MIGQEPVACLAVGQRLLHRAAVRDIPPRRDDITGLGQQKHGVEPDIMTPLVSHPVQARDTRALRGKRAEIGGDPVEILGMDELLDRQHPEFLGRPSDHRSGRGRHVRPVVEKTRLQRDQIAGVLG